MNTDDIMSVLADMKNKPVIEGESNEDRIKRLVKEAKSRLDEKNSFISVLGNMFPKSDFKEGSKYDLCRVGDKIVSISNIAGDFHVTVDSNTSCKTFVCASNGKIVIEHQGRCTGSMQQNGDLTLMI